MSKAGSPAGSTEPIFTFTSPIWFAGHAGPAGTSLHAVCVYVRFPLPSGVPVPPAKWSPSSTVTTNSVLLLSIPSFWSRWKKAANAAS